MQKTTHQQWQIASDALLDIADANTPLRDVVRITLERLHQAIPCHVLTLDLYHPAQDKLDMGGIHHATGTYHERPRPLTKERLPYTLLHKAMSPLLIPDTTHHTSTANSPFRERELVASVLVLSLYHANETVGILFINYRERHAPSDFDHDAIQRFQRHLSMALLNARLFQDRRQAIEQREQLRSLVKVIDVERNLNKQDREAILNEIANRASEVSGADRVTIRLVQDEHVAALAVYPRAEDTDENWTIRPGGHSQYIVDTNEPVIISDVDAYDPTRYDGIQINPRWQGVWKARIGLPLTSGEKTIGVMWLSFREPRYVTDVQLSAFQSFANIAFLTKMYDIEQERLQHALKILTDAHHLIHAASNTDAILRQTMHIAQRLVMSRDGSTRCISHIGTVIRDSTLVFLPQHNDEDVYDLLVDALPPDGRLDLHSDDACLVAEVVRTGDPIMITDASQHDNFLPLLSTEKNGSQIAVPIWVGDEIMAVVSVENAHPNRFAWYDQATLEVLASFVGQVLRNRQQQRMRAALFEASRAISTGRDLQSVLQAIARQTHAVLSVKRGVEDHHAYIGLREGETLIFHAGYPHATLQRIEASGHRTVDLHAEPVGVSATAMLTNTPQLVDNVRNEPMAFQDTDSQPSVVSILAVPIPNLTDDQPAVGVISLGHATQGQFDENDRDFMMLLAKFASVAIRRAQEIDAQTAQRESLWELTHAAMHQMIASHLVSNFCMAYNLNYPTLRDHIHALAKHKVPILKQINDSLIFDIVESAAESTQEPLKLIDIAYRDLTEKETKLPELGETTRLPLRDWLWNTYHTQKHIRLQLDRSITDDIRGIIPKYWLREVIKIVLDNALRAIKEAGYNPTERVIYMQVGIEKDDPESVIIHITNPGEPVSEPLRPLLTHRVIKREGGGRGIGLYMSGIIMRAYQGDIQYQVVDRMSSFILRIPIANPTK